MTASAAGLLTNLKAAQYSVTKHAAVALAEWLAITYGDQGLTVSVLCPQAVRTNMTAGIDGGGVAGVDGMLEPADVARAVAEGVAREDEPPPPRGTDLPAPGMGIRFIYGTTDERQRVEDWVEGGGVLVRFAGPRLAGGNDDLVPVELRRGDRTLGSALAWEQAQPLAPFTESSGVSYRAVAVDDQDRMIVAGTDFEDFVEPRPDLAPAHVSHFIQQARQGAYDGTMFHRLVKHGIIQGGDPLSKDPAKRDLYGTGGLNAVKADPRAPAVPL